jgi:uncharacterized membrane protein
MNDAPGIVKLPAAAALAALVGVADAVYLTVSHYTAEPVPCSLVEGCEVVLTSAYATFAGVPLAALGALAYFIAFSLAVLAAFHNRTAWALFGVVSAAMALFSVWLIYLQGAVLGAFCQFCLLSAATSFTLFAIYIASRLVDKKIA